MDNKGFNCESCKRVFSLRSKLNLHVKKCHSNQQEESQMDSDTVGIQRSTSPIVEDSIVNEESCLSEDSFSVEKEKLRQYIEYLFSICTTMEHLNIISDAINSVLQHPIMQAAMNQNEE